MGSLKYCDMPYPRIILNHLYSMQQSNTMCDMKLVVENEEICVHKLVLSAVSPYFRTLTNAEFKESVENKIHFSDTCKLTLETIIKFIYTGEIEINELNVYELMAAANKFQISLLKLPISQFLITSLDCSNCLQILAYVQLYDYDEVYSKTLKFIAENFHFVVTKDIFFSAPDDVVRHALCQRGLPLKTILNTLGNWLLRNGCTTKFFFPDTINLENLELVSNITKENNPQFKEIITSVTDFVKQNYSDKENNLINNQLKENQLIFAIGGSSRGTIHPTIESYSSCWSLSLPSLSAMNTISVIPPMGAPRMCHAAAQPCHRPDVVYVVGGLGTPSSGRALDLCERYDARRNEWAPMKEMPRKVKSHAAVWAEGKVVVMGGVVGEGGAVRDVWEYLEKDNCWRAATPLLSPRLGHCAVNVMGTLYVLGGQNNTVGLFLSSVERYNADLRTWSRVSDMPEAKYEFGCVAVNEYIYVIGGATRHFVLSSVHKYNTLTDKWYECAEMPVPKSTFGCTVRDDRIYCVGGSDIVHGPLTSVEVFNPHTNRWHYSSDKLLTPRSYSCAATVKIFVEESEGNT